MAVLGRDVHAHGITTFRFAVMLSILTSKWIAVCHNSMHWVVAEEDIALHLGRVSVELQVPGHLFGILPGRRRAGTDLVGRFPNIQVHMMIGTLFRPPMHQLLIGSW